MSSASPDFTDDAELLLDATLGERRFSGRVRFGAALRCRRATGGARFFFANNNLLCESSLVEVAALDESELDELSSDDESESESDESLLDVLLELLLFARFGRGCTAGTG